MELWLIILILFLLYLWLESGSHSPPDGYQEELDKILPLDEELRGEKYPTRIETYINYVVARGRITNASKREGWIGEDYRCEHYIKFQDGKSLSLSGNHTNTFLEGGINRIVFNKNNNCINRISYK